MGVAFVNGIAFNKSHSRHTGFKENCMAEISLAGTERNNTVQNEKRSSGFPKSYKQEADLLNCKHWLPFIKKEE